MGIAIQLASRGVNIVLISRNAEKLEATKKEITELTGVQTRVIAIDFTDFNEEKQKEVEQVCQEVPVSLLVNNAGISYPGPLYYHELKMKLIQDLITVNCMSLSVMTRLVIPQMEKRGLGYIVNMSSVSGVVPMYLYDVYCSTKAYVVNFSEHLDREYKDKGIRCSVQIPFTCLQRCLGPDLLSPYLPPRNTPRMR